MSSIDDLLIGIVLNREKMTKHRQENSNIANGEVIDTLVILSRDIVQVVGNV